MKIKYLTIIAIGMTISFSNAAQAKCYSGNSIRSGSVKICFLANKKAKVCVDGRCSNYSYTGGTNQRSVGGFTLTKKGSTYIAYTRV